MAYHVPRGGYPHLAARRPPARRDGGDYLHAGDNPNPLAHVLAHVYSAYHVDDCRDGHQLRMNSDVDAYVIHEAIEVAMDLMERVPAVILDMADAFLEGEQTLGRMVAGFRQRCTAELDRRCAWTQRTRDQLEHKVQQFTDAVCAAFAVPPAVMEAAVEAFVLSL